MKSVFSLLTVLVVDIHMQPVYSKVSSCLISYVVCVGLKLQFQLLNSEAFQQIGVALSPSNDLGDKSTALYSEDFLDKYARRRTLTGHHVVGTCRMGAPSDKTTVVDSELR